MPKHILVVSQYFYPEPFRINDMCCEWVKRGYKVTVLTGIPNYPEGRFYSGYSWFKKRKETWNGIEVIRIPLIARGKTSVGLLLNYLSFVITGFFWSLLTRVKADIVFTFEVSPMTQALIGVWYSKKRQIPNYLYVQDLWPENVETVTGIHSKLVIEPIGKMVNYIYRNCDRIFATSPSFVKEVQKRVDNKEKAIYWPQYAEDFYRPMPKRAIDRIPDDGSFKIVFTGNIGYAQGLEVLPKVARLLEEENVRFVIVGDGRYKSEFEKEISDCRDMFILVERQPAENIPEILAACDVAFVSFMNNDLFAKTIPAKLQSYMACGMPILASATGETERILREANCGICCKIGDAFSIAIGIKQLMLEDLNKLGQEARFYFEKHFDKSTLLDDINGYFLLEI